MEALNRALEKRKKDISKNNPSMLNLSTNSIVPIDYLIEDGVAKLSIKTKRGDEPPPAAFGGPGQVGFTSVGGGQENEEEESPKVNQGASQTEKNQDAGNKLFNQTLDQYILGTTGG